MRLLDDGGAECCEAAAWPGEPAEYLWGAERACGCVEYHCERCGGEETRYCKYCNEQFRRDEIESRAMEEGL